MQPTEGVSTFAFLVLGFFFFLGGLVMPPASRAARLLRVLSMFLGSFLASIYLVLHFS